MKISLCLLLFYGVIETNSQKCSCGSSGPEDKNLADCAESFANDQGIIGLVDGKNKEVCLSYNFKVKKSLPICEFPENVVATNINCDTDSDGSKNCYIRDPNRSNLKTCYPAQQFCVHNIQCQEGQTIQFYCNGLDLPKSSSGECLDEVRLKNDQIGEISLCGTKRNCKYFESIVGSLQISFTSSQCCHGCGYDFTVRCVPSSDIFSAGGVKKREEGRSSDIEIFGERFRRGVVRTKFVVPVGAKVYYRNNIVTVKKGYRTLITERTPTLHVYDEIFGVVISNGTAQRYFVGYGVMYIRSTYIYYHQQGIPDQFKPTAKERRFMSEALITLRTANKVVNTPITTTFSASVPGIPQILSRSHKRPSCQAKRETIIAFGNCGLPKGPGPDYVKRVQAKAKEQLHTSKNLFVKSVAQLVLKTFK